MQRESQRGGQRNKRIRLKERAIESSIEVLSNLRSTPEFHTRKGQAYLISCYNRADNLSVTAAEIRYGGRALITAKKMRAMFPDIERYAVILTPIELERNE